MKKPDFTYLLLLAALGFFVLPLGAQNNGFDTIFVDFGSKLSPRPWHNMTNAVEGRLSNVTTGSGEITGIDIRVFDPFNKINTNGADLPDPRLGFPATATEDSFFGNVGVFDGKSEPSGGIVISGLNTKKRYTFTLFASRKANDNRETRYIIRGQKADTLYLNTASNVDKSVTGRMTPASDGTIRIVASPGPRNDNNLKYYYLGAMRMSYPKDPPPPPMVRLMAPASGAYWQVGRSPNIAWRSQRVKGTATLDYSTDFGKTWTFIDSVNINQGSYRWKVPNTPSLACQVRLTLDTMVRTSPAFFEITPDTETINMVVLGSSTAEGQGVSHRDSAWVNRYRHYLQSDTRFQLTNLAKGGQTTFHVMPTGTPTPANLPHIGVDTARNITRALTFRPDILLLNFPSNDASNHIPVETQLANFRTLTNIGWDAGADVWVTTTQPRRFNDSVRVKIQEAVRDSILCTYANFAIDFWNGIADNRGFIIPKYNSGDNVHLNDRAHALLYRWILDTGIETYGRPWVKNVRVNADANTGTTEVMFHTDTPGNLVLRYTDRLGKVLHEQKDTLTTKGIIKITSNYRPLSNGDPFIFCQLVLTNAEGKTTRKVAAVRTAVP